MGRTQRLAVFTAAISATAMIVAGCGNSATQGGGTPVNGGTATFAEDSGAQPTWIFPFIDAGHNSSINTVQFEQLMYRPLYWFGQGDQPDLNTDLSLAQAPQYQNNNTKVIINLKSYAWSNGEKLTPADVMFFLNMLKAEKNNWASYTPGEFPDNVTSTQVTGPAQLTLTMDSSYSPDWFTDNELAQIQPMPLAWDKTSDAGAAGSGGCSQDASKCADVYTYLYNKSKNQSGYATDPLWQVVDGPWKLSAYNADGNVTFVPNPAYSGPVKPRLAAFKELPFTSETAEYNVLRSGNTINVGYIPSEDLPNRPANATSPLPPSNPLGSGYQLAPLYVWGWSYGLVNLANPTVGAIFKQPYVMQALQLTIDQNTDDTVAWRGYAVPTVGPIPTSPRTKWLSPTAAGANPYPFDPNRAKSLLTAHGWTEQNGVMSCTSPGPGNNQCGAGVTAGQQLNFTFEYINTFKAIGQSAQQWKSDAASAGISLNLKEVDFNTDIADTTSCPGKPSACDWQITEFGYSIFTADPTGDQFFLPGSANNYQSYNDSTMNDLVTQTVHQSGMTAFYKYEDYVAKQLPGTLNESDPYTIVAVSSNLQGVVENPLQTILPENWYFTK